MGSPLPNRKHAKRLDEVRSDIKPEIFFITICTQRRRRILASPEMHKLLSTLFASVAEKKGWAVGRYIVMPDHVHFFCAPKKVVGDVTSLSKFVGAWKSAVTRGAWKLGFEGAVWQKEFVDHLLRSDESYEEKWEYVARNAVHHGKAETPDEWLYQGDIGGLR